MTATDVTQTLVPYMESRTGFYRMLHKMYRWPLTQDELDALDGEQFRQMAEELDEGLMKEGFNDLYRALRRRNTGTRQVLSADFTKVFLGTATYEGFSAQPYASLFVGNAHQLMGSECNAVSKLYRKSAVKLSEGIDLPEDHLAFECEYLAILNVRATDRLREGDSVGAIELLESQLSFIREHVFNWLPRFYALASKLIDTRFYRGVLRITKGFFREEEEAIPVLMDDIEGLPSLRAAI